MEPPERLRFIGLRGACRQGVALGYGAAAVAVSHGEVRMTDRHHLPRGVSRTRAAVARSSGLGVGVALLGLVACADESPWQGEELLLRPGGDVVAAGGVVARSDTVPGDVMMAGRILGFDGHAGGSYLGAGAEQSVGGRIDGSVRAAGGSVRVGASVGRNVTAVGGSVELAGDADVRGNAYVAGGSVRLLGSVLGDVYAGAGDVLVDGFVGGDLRVEGATLTVGPGARIDGELRYRLAEGGSAAIAAGATIGEGVEVLEPRREEGGGVVVYVLRMLGFLVCGTVVVAVLPGVTHGIAEEIDRRPAAALGFGLLWVVLVPIAAVLTAVTLVGLPLAIVLAVLYGVSLYVAPVVPAVWVGGEILRGRDLPERGDAVLRFLTGGVIVAFAMLLPWVGLPARALAAFAGLGALVLALREPRTGPAGS